MDTKCIMENGVELEVGHGPRKIHNLKKVQSAFALDLFGTTKLWINIERQNLMEITQEELIVKYKEFASVTPEHLEEHEEEHEEKEQCKPMHHDVIEEQPELDREP
eukprot:168221_1